MIKDWNYSWRPILSLIPDFMLRKTSHLVAVSFMLHSYHVRIIGIMMSHWENSHDKPVISEKPPGNSVCLFKVKNVVLFHSYSFIYFSITLYKSGEISLNYIYAVPHHESGNEVEVPFCINALCIQMQPISFEAPVTVLLYGVVK